MPEAKADSPSLYAAREPVFPKAVAGFYRRLKWWIMGITLAVYYVTPWIRWDRGAHLPDQAVLIDLPDRRFFFFWIEIWPQEFYYVAGLLIMAGLALFLFTSVLGRVWCGYACPQTVWVDLYQHVERWIDGAAEVLLEDVTPSAEKRVGTQVTRRTDDMSTGAPSPPSDLRTTSCPMASTTATTTSETSAEPILGVVVTV